MSCIKGSTVNACRIFFSLLSVLTRDSIMFPRLKSGWLCKSPELSADCGSPKHHIPYIIQNQYLSSHSVSSGIVFFFFGGVSKLEGDCNLKAVPNPAYHLLLLFSSFTFLFHWISACSHIWWLWIPWVWDAFFCWMWHKMHELLKPVCVLFFQHTCFPLSLGDFWFSTKFCSIKTWNIILELNWKQFD